MESLKDLQGSSKVHPGFQVEAPLSCGRFVLSAPSTVGLCLGLLGITMKPFSRTRTAAFPLSTETG